MNWTIFWVGYAAALYALTISNLTFHTICRGDIECKEIEVNVSQLWDGINDLRLDPKQRLGNGWSQLFTWVIRGVLDSWWRASRRSQAYRGGPQLTRKSRTFDDVTGLDHPKIINNEDVRLKQSSHSSLARQKLCCPHHASSTQEIRSRTATAYGITTLWVRRDGDVQSKTNNWISAILAVSTFICIHDALKHTLIIKNLQSIRPVKIWKCRRRLTARCTSKSIQKIPTVVFKVMDEFWHFPLWLPKRTDWFCAAELYMMKIFYHMLGQHKRSHP